MNGRLEAIEESFYDELQEGFGPAEYYETDIKWLINRVKELEDENHRLRETYENTGSFMNATYQRQILGRYKQALEDFANHGTRHDTNPTMVMDDKQVFKLLGYIKSMDDYVRDKARQALEQENE